MVFLALSAFPRLYKIRSGFYASPSEGKCCGFTFQHFKYGLHEKSLYKFVSAGGQGLRSLKALKKTPRLFRRSFFTLSLPSLLG